MNIESVFEEFKKNFENTPEETRTKWLLADGFVKNDPVNPNVSHITSQQEVGEIKMKKTYAIKIMPPENGEKSYLVYIPDWEIYTQGNTIEECLYMAKDAIGLMGIDYEDNKKPIPEPKTLKIECGENEIPALVDVDFTAYRTKNDNRMVKKNCTIPAWLEKEATEKGVNFSAVLQDALRSIIG